MNDDSYLIRHFTNADISIDEPPKYLIGDDWYSVLKNKMMICGWTRLPSMEDILKAFRQVEYQQKAHGYYKNRSYQNARAFIKRITVYGWSNSGQVAWTLYRIKLHSENNQEYICWV